MPRICTNSAWCAAKACSRGSVGGTVGAWSGCCAYLDWLGVDVMLPSLPEPALMESSSQREQFTFAGQQLLAYYRGELADPHACAAVEEQLRRDRRWQAHWDSIRYLDLDRAAALQDAADLARFTN